MSNQPKNTKTILVIEDEPSLLEALHDKLKKEGFVVMQAKNGEEGLRIAFSNKPNLILLDIKMPIMDGVTMLEKLRKDEWGKTVPVFILTNSEESKNISDTMNQRVTKYLIKTNWKLQDIVEEIRLTLQV